MKKFAKTLSYITGFYYLLISISLFLATIFSLLVDRKYIFAIFDLLGFSNISTSLIKPISFVLLLFLFLLIAILTRRIFKAIKVKKYFISNMFIGFLFLILSGLAFFFLRDKIFIVSALLNFFLIIASMILLGEKSKDYYNDEKKEEEIEDEKEIITFEDIQNEKVENENLEEFSNKDNDIKKDLDNKNLDENNKENKTIEEIKEETEEEKVEK